MKEAVLYERLENLVVRCNLCAHRCRIEQGAFGFCGVRQNIDGALMTHSYGRIIAAHVDPIEKKPLYHYRPGSSSFSIATMGCNFRCAFCQNWEISQGSFRNGAGEAGEVIAPEEIVSLARKHKCTSISYTYTEPTIFFEYALDTAKIAKQSGLGNVFVTNGYMTAEALEQIRPYLDAANVDLKFFRDESYRTICAGTLAPVLDSIRAMHSMGVWVEVTTLVVPGENDSPEELRGIASFIASVDKNIPWHISRFHPDYKLTNHPATPQVTLQMASDIGRDAGLTYIYVGNVSGWGNDTYCPACKKMIIQREGFSVVESSMRGNACGWCGQVIAGNFLR